jgi:hypothetical protein
MLVGLMVPAVRADVQGPSTRPANRDKSMFPRNSGEQGPRFRGRQRERPTPEQWAETEAFLKEHSPHRWDAYLQLPENNPRKQALKAFIYARYASLRDLADHDEKLYKIRVDQLGVEDRIYGLLHDLKGAGEPAQQQDLKASLREAVSKWVDLNLGERKIRIQRLETALKVEQEKLAKDEKAREAFVDRQLEQVLKTGNERGASGRGDSHRRDRGDGSGAPVTDDGPPPPPPAQ